MKQKYSMKTVQRALLRRKLSAPRFPAPVAAQHMDVGAAAAPLEHTGQEDFVIPQRGPADRAASAAVPLKAVHAAPYVHEPVLAAGEGRVCVGLYQFPFVEPGGADRTHLGVSGRGAPPAGLSSL
jgi:hypothetical protein